MNYLKRNTGRIRFRQINQCKGRCFEIESNSTQYYKNAMYHVQKDGIILIKLFKASDDYIILVHDNGIGMDEETSKKSLSEIIEWKIDILAMVLE